MEAVERRNSFYLGQQLGTGQHRAVLINDVHCIAKGQHLVVIARMEQTA